MSGFKSFLLRGNLVELAVAFIMGAAFTAVVTATVELILSLVGKIGGQPDFDGWEPAGLPVGAWVTAVVSFLILSTVVYAMIVLPYTRARERFFPEESEVVPADVALLQEIRDLLAAGRRPSSEG